MKSIRCRAFEIVEPARRGDRASRVFDVGIVCLIGLNVAALVTESLPNLSTLTYRFFGWFELFSVVVFSLEYLVRFWSCVEKIGHHHPMWGRLRFAMRPMMVIDLLAVLPAFLPMVGIDLRFLRSLRLMRIFRLLKIGRYSKSLQAMASVFRAKREELVITVSVIGLLLLIASCLIYYAEQEAQPQAFSSIPAAMWWAVATVTTVGYGDIYPVTPFGKFIASVIAILGIGVFALPAGIVASGFTQHVERSKRLHRRRSNRAH